MVQVLHGSARTTQAVRRAIQRSQESLQTLGSRHGLDPKTVAKWRKRSTLQDARMGPEPASTVLTKAEEAIAVAFRRHTLLPLAAPRRLSLRPASPDSPPFAFGPAPLLSAPRHQPLAPERRRAEAAKKEVQELPHRYSTPRFLQLFDGE